MNVVSSSRAASVPSGAEALSRSLLAWYARLNGHVFLVSLVAGSISGSVRTGNPFVAWAAGLLGGWTGVVGASVGQLLGAWSTPASFREALGLSVSVAFSGAVAFLIFRYIPGIGRGLPNLGSYLWALESALLGGLLTSFGNTLVLGGFPGPRFWTGAAESLIAVLLLGPPVLLFADRHLRHWMEPIPGERPARRPRRLAGDHSSLPMPATPAMAAGDATVVLSTRSQPESSRRVLLWGGGMVVAVTLIAVPLSLLLPRGGSWAVLLYVIPILWSALEYGLRGGILAASASGLFYLLGTAWMDAAGLQNPGMDLWSRCADLLILSLVGAFVGRSREHEVRLRDELADSNRLLKRDLLRVAQALTQAVEAKDSYTEGHLRRVSEYAVAVGSRLGLRGHDLEMIHYASLLHDLGKIGIPEEILRKRGALTEKEAEAMRRHPDIGARLLEKLDLLRDAAPLVRAHQERYDGETEDTLHPGYPFGLQGEEIPVGARIIAVVDAFDAMTTNRPYRAALPVDSAIAELRNQRGKQFDPKVVDAFLDELADRPWVRDESWH